MPTSDEELAKAQQRTESLRTKVAKARAERDGRLREAANDVTKASLDAEAERLQAELDLLNEEKKASSIKAGAAPVLDQVKSGPPTEASPDGAPATSPSKE